MPLPLDMTEVLDEFITAIVCYNETSTKIDFEFKPVKGSNYQIAGVLIPPTNQDLNLFEEGEIRSGALVLYTYSTTVLYFHDITAPSAEAKQTYVVFNGDTYRIKGLSPRSHDGLHKKWTLVRCIERNG